MERTPYFSIATGEADFTDVIKSRGLLGLWNSKYPPGEPAMPGVNQRLEWSVGQWKASATKFFRTPSGQSLITLHAVVLTLVATEELEKWHADALKALSDAATQGAHEFNQTVKRLTGED